MKSIVKYLSILFIYSTFLYANNLDIDNLLENIELKTDLSDKTKLANGGVSYIYTREDLKKMQAHTLKDVLKSSYPFGYNENRYGLPDPYAISSTAPFMSSSIRIYIDNQEITTGLYGSGIIVYGDMDIEFVDHIEIYSGNPTFEYSSESAFTIIKLYSKVAQKDEGNKITIRSNDYGSTGIQLYTAKELENDWSYFTYFSKLDIKRKDYENDGAKLSRDRDITHLFGTLYNNNNNNRFLIDIIKQDRDTFISRSIFATPDDSHSNVDFVHIGYDRKTDSFSYSFLYDEHNGDMFFSDQNTNLIKTIMENNSSIFMPYSLYGTFKTQTYTIGTKYKVKHRNNNFLAGVKFRSKHFTTDRTINNIKMPDVNRSKQTISTIFIENQYSIATNKIITLGTSLIKVENENSNQNDTLHLYRIGYTYTNKHLISKTIGSHLEFTLDPYLVNGPFLVDPINKTPISKQNLLMQNFIYKSGRDKYELIASFLNIQDQLAPDYTNGGKLAPLDKDLKITSYLTRYTKNYRDYDKLEITLGLNHVQNLPIPVSDLDQHSISLKNFNTFGRYELFNEALYYKDNYTKKSFCDYSAGVIYHKTKDLLFSIKGTNLLDNARESNYIRLLPTDPNNKNVDPLKISPIDKTIIVSMEYTF